MILPLSSTYATLPSEDVAVLALSDVEAFMSFLASSILLAAALAVASAAFCFLPFNSSYIN